MPALRRHDGRVAVRVFNPGDTPVVYGADGRVLGGREWADVDDKLLAELAGRVVVVDTPPKPRRMKEPEPVAPADDEREGQ